MTRRAAFGGLALLGACALAPPSPAPVTPVMVRVPVAQPIYCDPPALEDPALPLVTIQPDSPPADTVRAYAASVAILKGAVVERDQLLAGCRRPAPGTAQQVGTGAKAAAKTE